MPLPANETPSCPKCRAAIAADARFCGQCGAAAGRQAVSPAVTERRLLAILFYDMVGSTILAASLDPEDFADVLGAFHRHVGAVIAQHHGHTARYLGDGGMIYFGYPHASEMDAERAVRAGLEIIASMPALSATAGRAIHVRVGISAGVAVTGDVLGMGPDVAGAAPNLAARLQGLAERDTLLIDDALHGLIAPLFDCRPLGARPVHGWAEPVRLWQVLGPAAYEGRFDARTRERRSPLIGRDHETAALRGFWAEACAGHGRAVLLRGDAGIGKSRLVAQLLDDTDGMPHRRYRLHCSPHQQGTPLHPCVELLERLAGFTAEDDDARRRAMLATRLAGAPPDDIAVIGHLLMLPPDGAHASLIQMSPLRMRDRTLNALLDGLGRAAEGQPVLMVLEDAHWADPVTLELTARMAARIGTGPMLMVVTARPDFAASWTGLDGAHTLSLDPLSPHSSAALARHAVAQVSDSLPESAVEAIVARCDGNPLFIEEVARGVAEATEHATRAVPASLQASLLGRLDRLGAARDLARVAAVIGREFDRTLLGAVADAETGQLSDAVARLLASGLVEEDGVDEDTYRFKHALIQDAAYDSITRGRRRELHARTAEVILALRPKYAAAQPHMIAHHFTEAGDPGQATQWWLRAARRSLQRSAAASAAAQMERALILTPGLPRGPARAETELEMQLLLGKALMATLGQSNARTGIAFARARLLCERVPQTPYFLPVLFGLWTHAFMQATLRSAAAQAAEITAMAAIRQDPAWTVVGHYATGYTQFVLGQFPQARGNLESAIALFDPARPERYTGVIIGNPRVLMRVYLSWALVFLGQAEAALQAQALALEEARAVGPVWTLVHALFQCGQNAAELHGPQAGLPCWEEARPLAREAGMALWEGALDLQIGWARGLCGDHAGGLRQMDEGLTVYADQLFLPAFGRLRAEVLLASGAPHAALETLARAQSLAQAREEFWDAAQMLLAEARIRLALGDADAAVRAARSALATARAQGARLLEARAQALIEALRPASSGPEAGRPEAGRPEAVHAPATGPLSTPRLAEIAGSPALPG